MAQVKRRLSAEETADRLGVSLRQFRRMVAAGVVRSIGQRRPGVASQFDRDQVEKVAAGRDYAAALARVAWNVQTARIRPGFQFWFRHDARGDFPGALRVLDATCTEKPPESFVKIAQDFAEGFAPGPLRYCIGLLFLHAVGRHKPMPPDARRFYGRISEAILGEPLDWRDSGIAKASHEHQSALASFVRAAAQGDHDAMLETVREYAPDMIRGEHFAVAGAREFMQWYRRTYGENRREVKPPTRAAVARLIPSPDDPRRSISRPVISKIACRFERALRQSPEKKPLFELLIRPRL
jgi:hypothetical protein